MASIKQTKKKIKKYPAGVLWARHARFWTLDMVNPENNYRGISAFFHDVDISELSKLTGMSKESITKYIIMTLFHDIDTKELTGISKDSKTKSIIMAI